MSEFLVITGLSGGGRSTAAATFEDLGWFVIDNMPPALIGKVAELVGQPGSETERVAFVVGRGGADWAEEIGPAIAGLRRTGNHVRTLFLETRDDVLVRRYEGTRRRHPLSVDGRGLVDGIHRERELLHPIKTDADVVVDTSDLNVHQLRDRLLELFASDEIGPMRTSVVSFGYKHGLPLDVDLVLDCRFLPNPHWVDELRPFTGLDESVRSYVLDQPETSQFLEQLRNLFALVLPAYVKEGKSYLTVAVGCTGGRHRSVVIAEQIASLLAELGHPPAIAHRDVAK